MSAIVRVPEHRPVPFRILAMATRIDREWMTDQANSILKEVEILQSDVQDLITRLDSLGEKISLTMEKALTLSENIVPVWDDSYNLCGDLQCFGDCRICQDGEYDGDEEKTEKYCRRGKR